MNYKIVTTLALLAATTLLQACTAEQLYYLSQSNWCADSSAYCQEQNRQFGDRWREYEQDLAAWEACEANRNGASVDAHYCGMRPSQRLRPALPSFTFS